VHPENMSGFRSPAFSHLPKPARVCVEKMRIRGALIVGGCAKLTILQCPHAER
jgi:hypothetical protein